MLDDYRYYHPPGTRYIECRCCFREIVASYIDDDGLCPDCEGQQKCGSCSKWVNADIELDNDGICPKCIELEQCEQIGA